MTETRYVTPSGRTVVAVEAEHPRDWTFVIDGKDAAVREFLLYRDGGTRRYVTSGGEILFPHRLGSENRTPRLDREPMSVEEEARPDLLVSLRSVLRDADLPVSLMAWMEEVERRLAVRDALPDVCTPTADDTVRVAPPVKEQPDDRIRFAIPGGSVFEGHVLYVTEVPHPVNGDDYVEIRLPVPHGTNLGRAAVMLMTLDHPPPVIGDDVGLRFEDEYPGTEH